MTTNQLRAHYYLERTYSQVSEIEFTCRIVVKDRKNNQELTRINTKINTLDTGQDIADSNFSLTPITWERFLNQTIQMLFNMLMFRLNITDLHTVDGQEKIAEFFSENPFHTE